MHELFSEQISVIEVHSTKYSIPPVKITVSDYNDSIPDLIFDPSTDIDDYQVILIRKLFDSRLQMTLDDIESDCIPELTKNLKYVITRLSSPLDDLYMNIPIAHLHLGDEKWVISIHDEESMCNLALMVHMTNTSIDILETSCIFEHDNFHIKIPGAYQCVRHTTTPKSDDK